MTATWTTEYNNLGDYSTLTYSAVTDLASSLSANVTPALHVGECDRLVFLPSAIDAAGDFIAWTEDAVLAVQFSMDGILWSEAPEGGAIQHPAFSSAEFPTLGYSDYNAKYIRFRHDGITEPFDSSVTISITVYKQYFGKAESKGRR